MRAIVFAVLVSFISLLSAEAQLIASRKPDGLAVSTGNVYFTSHDAAGATVWRTSQTSKPGQESVLFWEAGARFGDIVFAQINGNFFGFFFARKNNVITIRRVSLTGGNATVIATMNVDVDIDNSHRNLVTDGANLFWQDVSAIRKVSVNGGAVTTLDQTRQNTPTAGIVLQNGNIIYASVDDIRFVPTTGAITVPEARTIAKAADTVTALHAGLSGVYWGERDGRLQVKRSGAPVRTMPGTAAGFMPTSIATNGIVTANGVQSDAEVAWTRCTSQACQLVRFPTSGTAVLPIGNEALGAHISSISNVFWGDAAGVHRKRFNE